MTSYGASCKTTSRAVRLSRSRARSLASARAGMMTTCLAGCSLSRPRAATSGKCCSCRQSPRDVARSGRRSIRWRSWSRSRSVIGERDWSALYQQKPAPDEGLYFKREWFRWYDERPKFLRIYGASDYAVTDSGGDYTVHLVAGVDPDDNIYVLDVWRGQTNSDVWVESWLDLVRTNKPLLWAEEKGQIVKSIGPFLEKRMLETKTYCRREALASAADKPTHSRSIQARASMGKVYLLRNAPWLTDFLSELLTFPAGRTDDQVDAFGKIGRLLDEMVPASVPKEKPKARVKDAYERAGGQESDSYRTI